ncbi:MAG: Spy/CpxP family protein refolding chaperone [Hyphomicrobiales bacterium]|nr:Spy/CpxP family protein refolding chaperone [Hyphomicrobiales bacterium]
MTAVCAAIVAGGAAIAQQTPPPDAQYQQYQQYHQYHMQGGPGAGPMGNGMSGPMGNGMGAQTGPGGQMNPGQMNPGQMSPGQMNPGMGGGQMGNGAGGQMGPGMGGMMGGMMGGHGHHGFDMSRADRAAMLDAAVAGVHAGLKLTPDQERLWPAVETAVRNAAETRMAIHDQMTKLGPPANPIDGMQRAAAAMNTRAENLRKIADAAGPLYNALTQEQRDRLPMLMRQMGGGMMGGGMMVRGKMQEGMGDRHGGWARHWRHWRGEGEHR